MTTERRHCTSCGAVAHPDANFCAACGASVADAPAPPPEPEPIPAAAEEQPADDKRRDKGSKDRRVVKFIGIGCAAIVGTFVLLVIVVGVCVPAPVAEDINETQTPTVIPTPIPSIEKLEAEVVAIQQSLGEDRLAYERGYISEVEFSKMQRQAGIRAAKIRQRVTKLLGVEHLALARIVYNGHNYDRRVLRNYLKIIAHKCLERFMR